MIRVYTASKLAQASMWSALQKQWPGVYFHARWLRHVALGTPDLPENAVRFWVEDQEDVSLADAVLIYAAPTEHLRGALVEAGMAIAKGVPVIVLGDHVDYGTWQYHPAVRRAADVNEAYAMLLDIEEERHAGWKTA